MKYILLLILIFSFNTFSAEFSAKEIKQVKQQLIQYSINSYSGNCPCPYNRARNGSRCGRRSAYSRPGGAEPICYESDIPNEYALKILSSKKFKR
jgi:hypothetical protein